MKGLQCLNYHISPTHISSPPPHRMAAKRFVVDSQTFTQALWFLVPGGMAYGYAHFNTKDDETKEQEINENYKSTTKSARKGTAALGPIFAQRKSDGKFDAEMEEKLDNLLRAGNKKRVRVNTDNEGFHNQVAQGKDGVVVKEDWRVGLKGSEIVKEKKRRRKHQKKKQMLLEELEMLRESSETSNMPQVRERKKDIKRICKELGIDYNSPFVPVLIVNPEL